MAILLKVVQTGSLSAASRATRIPLPTISRKLSELEAHVGAKLLVRSTRRLSLTDAGQAYVTAARSILEQVEDAEQQAAGEFQSPKGELVIAAPVSFGRLHALPVIAEFLQSYPQIDVRLLLSDRNVHLLEDNIDLALRIGRLPDSSLVGTRIGKTRHVLCASPTVLASHGTPTTPEELLGLPLVSFDPLTAAPAWQFSSPGQARSIEVPVRPKLSVSSADAALAAAIAGVGLVRLFHYQCADAVAEGTLKIILAKYEPEPLPVHVLHPPRDALPSKTRAFLDFSTERLKRRMFAAGHAGTSTAAPTLALPEA